MPVRMLYYQDLFFFGAFYLVRSLAA